MSTKIKDPTVGWFEQGHCWPDLKPWYVKGCLVKPDTHNGRWEIRAESHLQAFAIIRRDVEGLRSDKDKANNEWRTFGTRSYAYNPNWGYLNYTVNGVGLQVRWASTFSAEEGKHVTTFEGWSVDVSVTPEMAGIAKGLGAKLESLPYAENAGDMWAVFAQPAPALEFIMHVNARGADGR